MAELGVLWGVVVCFAVAIAALVIPRLRSLRSLILLLAGLGAVLIALFEPRLSQPQMFLRSVVVSQYLVFLILSLRNWMRRGA